MPNGDTNTKDFWKEQGKMEQSIDHLSEGFQTVLSTLRRIEAKHDEQTAGLYDRINMTDADNKKEHAGILEKMKNVEVKNVATSTRVSLIYSVGVSLVIGILSAVILTAINGG